MSWRVSTETYLLHAVSGFTLETLVSLLSIDQDITADDSHGDSSSEHIEQGGLTSSRNSLYILAGGESADARLESLLPG
jgi:hypothetical protein